MGNGKERTLFGGDKGWKASDWTDSDDRVRGGASQSYFDITGSSACFHGNLDITALGGAGFASQRTMGDDRTWDLSAYDGIHLQLGKHDGKKYTLTLKDEILPPMADGREQSTISYEYDFSSPSEMALFVPWHAMKPTYRGKEKDDAPPLDTENVKRFSLMMRSFFGDQEGDFSLTVNAIKAVSQASDIEKGITGDGISPRGTGAQEPWSWKNSNLVGLAVILSSTWAISWAYCWWKGYDMSFMRFGRWWSVVKK
ncbi:CIA30 family protein [Decorospora gaudefroyi]|uniref:CIA30 family protein n=1 Tax=Decorospora gaudefroyi TaxID=184978 RepID=A0A6A5JYP2_9PLEO|nr:CIA30 family protein [Decorospora gaudefroyi]